MEDMQGEEFQGEEFQEIKILENKPQKAAFKLPEPPDFLLKASAEQATKRLDENQPAEPPSDAPRSVDFLLYHQAIEERKVAEVRTAEIYSKYLEIVNFSEKLLHKINRFDIYKKRVREVYNHALRVDQIAMDNLKLSRRDLDNSQKLVSQLNMEHHALQASVQAHQEAFEQMTRKLGQAEAAMEYANQQFQLLSDEYEKRGLQIQDLEKRLRGATAQVSEISEKYKEAIKKAEYLHDQHLLISNELRESHLKEAAVSALNEDLTNSIPKLQKQIHILEEKLRQEREEAGLKTAAIQDELERLKENKLVDALVEKSKKTVAAPTLPPPTLGQKAEERLANREKWNEFYSRFSQVIGELTSHSAPLRIKEEKEELPEVVPQLISEKGDVDWV